MFGDLRYVGFVPRPFAISVEFSDRHGAHVHGRMSGFFARVFQHENDHLNGRLYTDLVQNPMFFVRL
jgi:peptide deformylase